MWRRRSLPIAVFAVWTLFIWVQRIVNIVNDDDLSGSDQAIGLARAITFVVAGLAVGVVAIRRPSPAITRRVVGLAAGITIALWVVQMIGIPLRDHSVGFIVVHLVLGAVSVSVAWWALRSVRDPDGPDAPDEPRPAVDATVGHA